MEVQRNEQDKTKVNLIILGFSLLSFLVLIFSLVQLHSNGEVVGDQAIDNFAEQISNPFINQLFTLFSSLGSKWGIITSFILALILLWWKYRDYIGMGLIAITVIGGDFINKWVKDLIGRERPMIEGSIIDHGYSFPSGHAMVGLAFYGFFTYLILNRIESFKLKYVIAIGVSVIVFLIGVSRVILNAHYFSDVMGGFAIGFFLLCLCMSLYGIITPMSLKKNNK